MKKLFVTFRIFTGILPIFELRIALCCALELCVCVCVCVFYVCFMLVICMLISNYLRVNNIPYSKVLPNLFTKAVV